MLAVRLFTTPQQKNTPWLFRAEGFISRAEGFISRSEVLEKLVLLLPLEIQGLRYLSDIANHPQVTPRAAAGCSQHSFWSSFMHTPARLLTPGPAAQPRSGYPRLILEEQKHLKGPSVFCSVSEEQNTTNQNLR